MGCFLGLQSVLISTAIRTMFTKRELLDLRRGLVIPGGSPTKESSKVALIASDPSELRNGRALLMVDLRILNNFDVQGIRWRWCALWSTNAVFGRREGASR